MSSPPTLGETHSTVQHPSPAALTLPHELTAKIFVYCLPVHRRVRPDQNQAPLQLAQICGHWRAVWLATPELWTSILFEFPENPYVGLPTLFDPDAETPPDYVCDLFDLWLTRAAGYPLSITVRCRIPLQEKVLEVMAAHSAHWGRIELEVTEEAFSDFNNITGPFPMLRILCISVWDGDSSTPHAIFAAPNLESVDLESGFPRLMSPHDVVTLPASLTSLKVIHINSAPLEEFIRIIQHFTRLLHLGLSIDCVVPTTASTRTVIPGLKSLLQGGNLTFISLIEIPTLEHLEVSLFHVNDVPILSDFLAHSARHLTHLALDLSNSIGDEFATVLSSVPSLRTLELLCFNGFNESVIPRYGVLQRTDLIPQLRTLFITHHFYDSSYASFLAVVRTRIILAHAELKFWSTSPKNDLHIPQPGPDILAALETLTVSGREIRLRTPHHAWLERMRDPDAVGTLGGVHPITFPLVLIFVYGRLCSVGFRSRHHETILFIAILAT
ncbi:hypothetical protein B0H11DRAFT_2222104 [Mycena galericulata]|nr:hypothetical protein B0H11DRAFT_2222104 [Mycena galericulata]